MAVRDLTDALLMDMLRRNERPVLAEFWSPGCSACREAAPQFEQAAKDLGADVECVRLNVDANGHMASRLGVKVTPTFVLLCRNEVIAQVVGTTNATILRNTVRDALRRRCRGARNGHEIDGYA
jgi:thioredoxin 2